MTAKDKQTVRELAKQYMEMALSEKQAEMNRRMLAMNDLNQVRPPVMIDEIPWFEINIGDELTLTCEDGTARGYENYFKQCIYRWKHFKADTAFEPFIRVTPSYDYSGIGLSVKEKTLATDEKNHIVAHRYTDVLEDESAAELIHDPIITMRPDRDDNWIDFLTDMFGDSIPVKKTGVGYYTFIPWDDLSYLRGVEPILMDMYDRPEYLHRIMKKLTSAACAALDQLEKYTTFSNASTMHCTPAYISGLEGDGCKATWFRGTAQMFSTVSPAMHEEFEINYIKPIAERFAYSYYGCCEPLDNKIDVIKKIKNLRKIGVSPWADPEVCAEKIGSDYVYARKPNPANVALSTDPEVIRNEIETTVRACIKYGCPCEFVLKDISTVSYKPKNLIIWSETVSSVLDEYYGA